jgi:sugar phosphate isomerase/epimerase
VSGLTCSANTLRYADLHSRIRAAAAAGFSGIGLRLDDCRTAGSLVDRLPELLVEHGLRLMELEHSWDWAAPVPAPAERALFAVAETVGYRQLNVPMFAGHPIGELVSGFRRLCDRAAEHGLLVGLEFLPYSAVPTLGSAWAVVAGAQRDNGGLVIDLWHWHRSGAVPSDLGGIDASRIIAVQLCDVLAEPMRDLKHEARHHRQLPGHGAGDTVGVLTALRRHGLTCPVSVEVFSDALDSLPAGEAAGRAAVAGGTCLAAAGWTDRPWRTNLEAAR